MGSQLSFFSPMYFLSFWHIVLYVYLFCEYVGLCLEKRLDKIFETLVYIFLQWVDFSLMTGSYSGDTSNLRSPLVNLRAFKSGFIPVRLLFIFISIIPLRFRCWDSFSKPWIFTRSPPSCVELNSDFSSARLVIVL